MADLFGGAAPYYAKYRTRPPEPAIAHLAAAFGADSTVLDLGCGPGTLAIPPAGRVREVRPSLTTVTEVVTARRPPRSP